MNAESSTGAFYLIDSAMQVAGFLVLVNLVRIIALSGIGFINELSFFDRWWIMNMQFWDLAYLALLFARPVFTALAARITKKVG